jgi:hypothetical protein
MRVRLLLSLLLLFGIAGCNSTTSNQAVSATARRSYNGTASVGDFLNITLDPVAKTLTYTDVSNGETGVVPYTVNADDTYTLSDPGNNLVAAYEVPNYALLVQANKTGATKDAPALITAVLSGQISLATWEGRKYNYMQFRTSSGGLEVGSVAVGTDAILTNTSYWPYGAMNQSSPFHMGTMDASRAQADPSGTFFKMPDDNGNGTFDYVFGTGNGIFAVDTPQGAILGLKQAASKNFDPTFAGTYKAIYYEKTGATTGMGNVEVGTPGLGSATMTITTAGQVIVQGAQGNTLVPQTALVPIADSSYLYGSGGQLQDPCWGLFTFRITDANAGTQQDVFVTFMDRAILFSSFKTSLPLNQSNTYDYLYGAGLK